MLSIKNDSISDIHTSLIVMFITFIITNKGCMLATAYVITLSYMEVPFFFNYENSLMSMCGRETRYKCHHSH